MILRQYIEALLLLKFDSTRVSDSDGSGTGSVLGGPSHLFLQLRITIEAVRFTITSVYRSIATYNCGAVVLVCTFAC